MPIKSIEAVDRDLREIINAVEEAANWGMAHREEPEAVQRTLQDCEELIRHVMDASVLDS